MRSRHLTLTAGLAGFVLGFSPSAGLAAARPALSPVSDAYDASASSSGAAFQSDGSRYVSFADAKGELVALDARTGTRTTVPLSACDASPTTAPIDASLLGPGGPNVFYPSGLSQGTLITFCFGGTFSPAPEQFRLISLASGTLASGTSRLVEFDPPANDGPLNDLTGPGTDGADWADVLGGTPGELDQGLFDFADGRIVEPAPTPAADEYEDLDSPQLTHRLCAPVTTKNVEDPAAAVDESIGIKVVGFARPWAVLELDADTAGSPQDGGPTSGVLYAWRCGASKPVRLGSVDPEHAQFGAGFVSWVDEHGTAYAEDLATGRRWTWPAASGPDGAKVGYAEALHTASRIYVVPDVTAATSSGPQKIYSASLSGLLAPRPR